jgi:outer membrane protein OmpA-like peptidoglycan-associated protein
LTNLSQALQSPELLESKFAVEGHTDAKGNPDFNLKLSEQRAIAVREFLKVRGVLPDRLIVSGKGSTDLANDAAPYSAENRRVRIVNLD